MNARASPPATVRVIVGELVDGAIKERRVDELVELDDDVFARVVVTRKATWKGWAVELVAWGLRPGPFLVLVDVEDFGVRTDDPELARRDDGS